MQKSRNIFYPVIILLVLIFGIFEKAFSQDNTLFFMPTIPQDNQLNPALMYRCRTYVELPVISSVGVTVRNTGFGFHDAIHQGSGAQSGNFYLDLNNLEGKLKNINYFHTELNLDLLGVGFAIKDWYFTFGIANHTDVRLAYPKDIVALKDGNWNVANGKANTIQLSGLGMNATMWNSIGISAAHEIREGLKIGARLSYLQGMANLNTRRSTIELNTNSNPIILEAQAKYKINISFPVQLGYNNLGLVNSIDASNAFGNIVSDFIFNKNRGLAVDAGVLYDLDEKTQLSASVTDLGFIWWKKNVNNLQGSGKYTFDGINLDQYQLNQSPTDFMQAMQDSLLQSFNADGTTNSYFTATPIRIFAGATYEIIPKLKAGVMTKTEMYDLRIRPSLSFSLNYTPFRSVAASLSYTIMNNKFNQVGAGIALGNKGAQFYIITDNIPVQFTQYSGSALRWPYNARMLSLRFGLNLLFGCKDQEKKHGPKRYSPGKICPAYQ